jgi:acyl-CoA thioesterase-1
MLSRILLSTLSCAILLFGCDFQANSQNAGPPATKTQPASSGPVASGPKPGTPAPKKRLVFFGNSLTAGYGVPQKSNFPSLIAQKIDSAGLNYTVVNAGVSGETTAGGLRRIGSVLRQPVDVFVLELGANDLFRGVPVAQTRQNLQGIIDAVRRKYPKARVVVAGMQVPGLEGSGLVGEFNGVFREVAARNKAVLIPYLLQGVGGVQELNLPDGIHPTTAGYRVVARTVWAALLPVLQPQPAGLLR